MVNAAMRQRRWIAAIALALAAGAPAAADELVVFTNGKAMRVEKTRREGKWLYLSLGAEQEMAVLARLVRGVEASPAPVAAVRGDANPANVLGVSAGGGVAYTPPPVAEAYDPGEVVAEEGAAVAPGVAQPPPQLPPQGQELAPRGGRRAGGRFPRGN
jgi:hypothetical protein